MEPDSDDSPVKRLVVQCRSNDIDVKVDAITKLQAEFEAGAEITDPDALLTVLKQCLRTPNQHLTTATLSALPPLLPLITARAGGNTFASPRASPTASTSSVPASSAIDAYTLRQILAALLPTGGVLERLGDSRERARDKARETLVVLGGLAFRATGSSTLSKSRDGKGVETPLAIFEKHLREGGLSSKVWRVREQAILTLVHIRRSHHLFPLRPYLPQLVEALEDTDGNVRECARQSVVELFTGPGVTDAARADLKKEMTKKNVRKNIVDGVLTKVLAGGSSGLHTSGTNSEAGSENGEAGSKEYVPPSIALMNRKPGAAAPISRTVSHGNVRELPRPSSRAAVASPPPTADGSNAGGGSDVTPVYIASSRDLENEFASMLKHFDGKETEHNWAPREKAIQRVRGMLKGDAHERYTETFLQGLKQGFIEASLKTLASLRTTVAANTCSLYSELALALGPGFDPLCEPVLTNLLRMASLTKKIVAQQSQSTVTTILGHTTAHPRLILPLLWSMLQDKATQTRVYVMGHVKTYLQMHAVRSKHAIENAGGVELLEKCIKRGLADSSPGTREVARASFWIFDGVWHDRGAAIMASVDGPARKQLEKACPNPELMASTPVASVTPVQKKSSVAAAIAASRAKAKAIATAPPTLRHQATATSHAVARATSPKRATSPSLSTSSSTGAVRPASPISRMASSPPRARIVSGPMSRSVSSTVPSTSHARNGSGQSQPATPPSPTLNATYRRRESSPLSSAQSSTNSNSTFRRAVATALPASPPSSLVTLGASPTPRPVRANPAAVPIPRESFSIAGLYRAMPGSEEESLLLATNIPIPEDSDSDMESLNPISFSTPFELYPPDPKSQSPAASFSPMSSTSRPGLSYKQSSNITESPPAGVPQPIVEDVLRARAEQAESAAERLLELVEPDEDGLLQSPIPPSLLLHGPTTPKVKRPPIPSPFNITGGVPKTPVNNSAAILRQAAQFQDSPAYNGKTSSLLDTRRDVRYETSEWWKKRTSLISQRPPVEASQASDSLKQLQDCISALEQGSPDVLVLKNLALLCVENPVDDTSSSIISSGFPIPASFFGSSRAPASITPDLWVADKAFDRLFNALVKFLDPGKSELELEYGLIILWEMLENQAPFLEGREATVFDVLLQMRYTDYTNVLQATNMFRDTLTSRIEPVYGLTTLHASLKTFRDSSLSDRWDAESRALAYAYGLIALGKFILRLPGEVLEEELPRLRATLISALSDGSSQSSLTVREAAAAAIIAAQLVLRDEAHVFALLDGLSDDKKNLLTYLFDKHGSRGSVGAVGPAGMEKLEREMHRLDKRISVSPRAST